MGTVWDPTSCHCENVVICTLSGVECANASVSGDIIDATRLCTGTYIPPTNCFHRDVTCVSGSHGICYTGGPPTELSMMDAFT
jgi:hypothetical protein